jgi:hypothetical protein
MHQWHLESYAPVARNESMLLLLGLVAREDLELYALDVKTAFLNGDLEEEVWMEQPQGFVVGNSEKKCKLNKALYGLKQAARAWHIKLLTTLKELGFSQGLGDRCIFYKDRPEGRIIVLFYVDDALVAAMTVEGIDWLFTELSKRFDLRNLGPASQFLGREIVRDRKFRTLTVTQCAYTKKIIAKFGMEEANPRLMPMCAGAVFKRTQAPKELLKDEEQAAFAEIIGSLLYLAAHTRPDIAYAVGALSRYMTKPSNDHWRAAKGIVRYLAGTVQEGITFGQRQARVEGYCDSDFAGDIETRRSRSGYIFMFGGGAFAWNSKLQTTVATSTAGAEYVAGAAAAKMALYVQKLMADFAQDREVIQIKIDNQGALMMINAGIDTPRTKHISVAYHFVRESCLRQEIEFVACKTGDQAADFMTKSLGRQMLNRCKLLAGM